MNNPKFSEILEALHVRDIAGFSLGFLLVNLFFIVVVFIGV